MEVKSAFGATGSPGYFSLLSPSFCTQQTSEKPGCVWGREGQLGDLEPTFPQLHQPAATFFVSLSPPPHEKRAHQPADHGIEP